MQNSHRISEAVSRRFQALDRRLHIDHRGRSEWIWAVPMLTFAGTFVLIAVFGAVISGVSPLLFTPIGLIVALATAGMSVAYMTPEADTPDDRGRDDGGRPAPQPPPPPSSGWARWLHTWREEELPREPTAPRRREQQRQRERAREEAAPRR